jgi:alkyl hydroperoxide reductase subunit AhpC
MEEVGMQLQVGDRAPEFTLSAAKGSETQECTLQSMLEGNRSVVITSYVLDFTGG